MFEVNFQKGEPKFKVHYDGPKDEFLGHFFGYDVWLVFTFEDHSLTAQWGDEDPDYASQPLAMFLNSIADPTHRIGSTIENNKFNLPFREYLFSPHVIDYHKAWIIGLLLRNA